MAGNKHLIFLIHGMGTYVKENEKNQRVPDDAWFKSAEKSIKSAYNSHEFLKKRKFEDHFEFYHLNYDHHFNRALQTTESTLNDLSRVITGKRLLSKATKFVSDAAELDSNFFWTHAFDVILYKFLPQMRENIRVDVATTIFDQVVARQANGFSIIAHSLGTAVAQDVLISIHREILKNPETLATFPQARIVAMIANVANVLSDNPAASYSSALTPGESRSLASYLNATHELDPFTAVCPFNPRGIDTWDEVSSPDNWHRYYPAPKLKHYNSKLLSGDDEKLTFAEMVPHQFAHYFASPKVHLPIFYEIAGEAEWPLLAEDYIKAQHRGFLKNVTDSEERDSFKDKLEGLEPLTQETVERRPELVIETFRQIAMQIGG